MKRPIRVSRREAIAMSVAAGALASPASMAIAKALGSTPPQVQGPFYPRVKPDEQDADLTRIAGGDRAAGQVIRLQGRVLNTSGEPIAGARVEIWQANAAGRYAHPNDSNPAPLDPNFQGYAALTTDAEGRFNLTTIKPGAYPMNSRAMRPPHIHFDIKANDRHLITQMYFEGEPLNQDDYILQRAGSKADRLIVPFRRAAGQSGPEALLGQWDVVLDQS
jgi:protocatechuate 3,4-dioxygenase beta subunit